MKKEKLALVTAMVIYGTIGICRQYTSLSSAWVAAVRGLIGTAFLAIVMLIKGKKPAAAKMGKKLPLLFLSGAGIGFNWVLLFEAYRYTSVSKATICYYMAPVLVVLLSPLLLKEKLTVRKALCAALAVAGMLIATGVSGSGSSDGKGILLGLAAAVLYACVVLINRKIQGVDGLERTIIQLAMSFIVLVPYVLLTEGVALPRADAKSWIWLVVMGVVHTGIAYALYFSAVEKLPAVTSAIMSYIDPVVAILLSYILLGESVTPQGIIGSALVIAAAVLGEVLPQKKQTGE